MLLVNHSYAVVLLDKGGQSRKGDFIVYKTGHSRRELGVAKKREILERDAFTCIYCGEDAEVVDHVVPFSYSGCEDDDNLVASCSLCNLLASDMVFTSLIEKARYIKGVRSRRRKPNSRISQASCPSCGRIFKPRDGHGSTKFICSGRIENDDLAYEQPYVP